MITKIVNLSINSCVVPDCFKLAMLNPLLKKMGLDFQIFANFRPISNLMFLSKLSERVVAVQLINPFPTKTHFSGSAGHPKVNAIVLSQKAL